MKLKERNKNVSVKQKQRPQISLKSGNIVNRKIQAKSLESKQRFALMGQDKHLNNKIKQHPKLDKNVAAQIVKQKREVFQYEKQIMLYIKSKQALFKVNSSYLKFHEHLTHKSRSNLVKYFFKVGRKFKLKRQTIYLAVHYMDNFFSRSPELNKEEGIISAQACLFMAMKYCEIYPPRLHEWTQSLGEIILAQAIVLKKLDFNLGFTTIQNYLQYIFSKVKIQENDKQMIRLIADVSLFDQSMHAFAPSDLSMGMVYSIINPSKLSEDMEMSLKWMMERNQKHMAWCQTFNLNPNHSQII